MNDQPKIVVLTGAGISAESGIPTYRESGSGWVQNDLEAKSHASRYGNHLPELWKHWNQQRALSANAQPNAAHLALASLQDYLDEDGSGWLRVVTQNVDGLHSRAGSRRVIELHGNINQSRCLRCKREIPATPTPTTSEIDMVPACPYCGSAKTRPMITLFGEKLKKSLVDDTLCLIRHCDALIAVGTSGEVLPVAGFPEYAKRYGKRTFLVNKAEWAEGMEFFDGVFLGNATEELPMLLDALKFSQS